MVRCPPRAPGFSREQSARPNHYAIIYRSVAYSRLAVLVPAQSRTNLGHRTNLHYTKQFPLPHHAPTFSRINPPDGLGQTLLVELPPNPVHPAPIPCRFPGCQVTALTTQASKSLWRVNPPPVDPHTGSRRDSPLILNSPLTHTRSTVPTPSSSSRFTKAS